jgi:transcriptional regulator with XRE-family HTH domain
MNYNDAEFEEKISEFYKKVGQNVKRARKKRKITQLQLAESLNFKSVASVSNAEICYDNHHFSLAQLYKISLVLDVDIKTLVEP